MTALAPAERSRLARVLGLLGSPHAGERDAAALAADRLVRGRGLSWADVLEQQATGPLPPLYPRTEPSNDPAATDLRACIQRHDLLTTWEAEFVAGLAQRSAHRFSAKQRTILAEIALKVRSGPRA